MSRKKDPSFMLCMRMHLYIFSHTSRLVVVRENLKPHIIIISASTMAMNDPSTKRRQYVQAIHDVAVKSLANFLAIALSIRVGYFE